MIVTKIIVVLLMVAGVCIALYIAWRKLTVSEVWEFFAFLIVPPGMINVARWFWWRINAYTEIAALSLGLVLGFANLYLNKTYAVLFGYLWSDIPFEIKIAFFTAIVIAISIIVTFLTPAVSKEKLEKFYRKVRPGGAWGILSSDIRELPGKALTVATIIDVAGGIMLCYGISLAIGYSILLKFEKAGICCLLAVIGGFIVFRWYKKEVKVLAQSGGFRNVRGQEIQEKD
jgi:hypothetical protein